MNVLRASVIVVALAASVALMAQQVPGASRPRLGQRLNAEPNAVVVTHNGMPALEFKGADGWSIFVTHGMRQGEPTLGFAVALNNCQGHLYVSRTRLGGDFRNTNCESFDIAHKDITAERNPGRVVLRNGSSSYVVVLQGERGTDHVGIRGANPIADLLARSVNNFDLALRNVRHLTMTAKADTQPQLSTAAAAKTTQPAAQPATLTITSDPADAQVYVNDEQRGMTSSEGREVLHLAPGTYRIRVSLPGYKDSEQQVALTAAKPQQLTAKLEPTGPPPFTPSDVAEMLEGKMSPKGKRVRGNWKN